MTHPIGECVCVCVRARLPFIFLRCETENSQKTSKSSEHNGKRQRLREMRTYQSQSQRGASNSLSGGGVSPHSSANTTLISALLILTIPICYSKSNIYLFRLLWSCLCLYYSVFNFLVISVFIYFIVFIASWVMLMFYFRLNKTTLMICRMPLKCYCWVSVQTWYICVKI